MAATIPFVQVKPERPHKDNDGHGIISAVCMDILYLGASVVKLYDPDSDTTQSYQDGITEAFMVVRRDGDTPHGRKSMGGITKHYRVASHPEVVRANLDDNAKQLFCEL